MTMELIPDENLEYVTSSDTSKIAIAGNLWNYDPKNGKLYLLGCMSKLLSVSDSLKPPCHKECLALCLNLKNWEAYILLQYVLPMFFPFPVK